jgi:hypothetical protein
MMDECSFPEKMKKNEEKKHSELKNFLAGSSSSPSTVYVRTVPEGHLLLESFRKTTATPTTPSWNFPRCDQQTLQELPHIYEWISYEYNVSS